MESSENSGEVWFLCRAPREEICHLRYTLEAYEGLCVSTTIPGRGGLVRIFTSAEQADDLEKVLNGMAGEMPLEIIERGEGTII